MVVPSGAIVTSIGFTYLVFGSGDITLGSSMFAPSLMAGVTTMKMISSTSTTSTSGVMLISGLAPLALFPPTATPMTQLRSSSESGRVPLLGGARYGVVLQLVEQLARGAAQRGLDAGDARVQVVEGDHRRNGDQEAEGRLDQRLGDAAHDRRDAGAARGADALEGADDADHGA